MNARGFVRDTILIDPFFFVYVYFSVLVNYLQTVIGS
jgi:hypothetical protein